MSQMSIVYLYYSVHFTVDSLVNQVAILVQDFQTDFYDMDSIVLPQHASNCVDL